MVFKNLSRRRVRTLLTMLGISIGVAAIVTLGALANGLEQGYNSIITGSKADMILGQQDAIDLSTGAVPEDIGRELAAMPEVAAASGLVQGFVRAESVPYFFVYGYPAESFVLERFRILEGTPLNLLEGHKVRGKPVLLGASAAEAMHKQVGDIIRLQEQPFRIVGIYETGDTLEDNGAVLLLADAQQLLGRPRVVSLYYLQLEDPSLGERLKQRVERRWTDLVLNTTSEYADKQITADVLKIYVWAIAGLAVVIGGVGMMNAQLMAVIERTREIGVLRAVGWSRRRVMWLILMESLVVCLVGGFLGMLIAGSLLYMFSDVAGYFGSSLENVTVGLLVQATVVMVVIALVAGLYPAWRAARMQPVEALRYEGGSGTGGARRLPVGGMALQSLWQRRARTFLTIGLIAITVGGIMALDAMLNGVADMISGLSADAEIMIRQANVADTELSALDERVGDKIAAFPEVAHVSGFGFSGTILPDSGTLFILFGYAPNEWAIHKIRVVEGEKISGNHQIMLGSMMADALDKSVGDMVEVAGNRFKVSGIYQGDSGWQEIGGVISLRDAQVIMGRPRKVSMYLVKLHDPARAEAVVERINSQIPDVHASLSGEFFDQMPDMAMIDSLMAMISFLAIAVGGVGVMNAMLMAVYERTREIGVLRALGWRQRSILGQILQESFWLGIMGAILGTLVAFGLGALITNLPMVGDALKVIWTPETFARAILIALLLGFVGGLYPAYRATRLQPVEALRYE